MALDISQMLLKEEQMHILTHGYVHGHVHQHDDHMHIHGHFHNHDHVNDLDVSALDGELAPNSQDQTLGSLAICKELESHDVCSDILCDDLDDCYFYNCEKLADHEDECSDPCCSLNCDPECNLACDPECNLPCEGSSDGECCHDPHCLESDDKVCTDPECLQNDHHDNSLCALQKSKMSIFEKLIENVQKNIEALSSDIEQPEEPSKRRKLDNLLLNNSSLQIHFPHHCHPHKEETNVLIGQTPVLPSSRRESHNIHQSCFHAKVPVKSEDHRPVSQSDYDFFIQFNNFKRFLDEGSSKISEPKEHELIEQPSLYACKWERCAKTVDDSNLVSHVVDDHLKNEYQIDQHNSGTYQPAFECEWENCNFVDADFGEFLSHLNSHRHATSTSNLGASDISNINNFSSNSDSITSYIPGAPALPTPASIYPADSPNNGLNITAMKICPKAAAEKTPLDPEFTCRWHVGTDMLGQPIVCNKTHNNEGELQHHLQEDHIGLGKPVYACCWVGCERCGGKPFVQRQKLFRHIHIHTHYKPCECKVCGSKFATPAMLNQHMRTHSGEKPFECSICGKKFTTSSSLSIHNRVHSGERPLECKWPGCGKRFSESSNLAKHMRVHTKTYTCEVCGEVFDKKTGYTKHKKSHLPQNGPIGPADPTPTGFPNFLDYIQT